MTIFNFWKEKNPTQTEFFHTFNELHDSGKQIVISSDRHPSKLRELDDRLRSRFQWNIVADIKPPDYETRVAILRKKAELENVEIDNDFLDVIDLIAEKVKFNIRELESALSRIISYSTLFHEHIDVKYARKNQVLQVERSRIGLTLARPNLRVHNHVLLRLKVYLANTTAAPDVLAAVLKECITITVQLFDGHVGNDQTHLSVNNVFNQFLLCFDIQSQ